MMARLRAIPPYTVIVGLLLLAVMVYALARGNPLGIILAVVLIIFLGVPTLLIWLLVRRDAARDPDRDRQERAAAQALWQHDEHDEHDAK